MLLSLQRERERAIVFPRQNLLKTFELYSINLANFQAQHFAECTASDGCVCVCVFVCASILSSVCLHSHTPTLPHMSDSIIEFVRTKIHSMLFSADLCLASSFPLRARPGIVSYICVIDKSCAAKAVEI